MENLISIKFQDEKLQDKLLQTGNRLIIECNYYCDTYWGVCKCSRHKKEEVFEPLKYGTGQNKLGKILMKIRKDLQIKKKCKQNEEEETMVVD